MDEKEKEWTLRELAAETGVPERTIRFYISRGLVDPPLRGGRGAAYGAGHKARLEEIRKLQAKGLMLAEIAHVLKLGREESDVFCHFVPERHIKDAERAPDVLKEERLGRVDRSEAEAELKVGGAPSSVPVPAAAPASYLTLPEPEEWRAYGIAEDTVVMLRAGAAPWRTRRLLAALRRFAAMINDGNANDPKEGDDE
jgi:DNA-binding transcriptional MerR regulator